MANYINKKGDRENMKNKKIEFKIDRAGDILRCGYFHDKYPYVVWQTGAKLYRRRLTGIDGR